jgi:hypothetical protein
MLSAVVLLCISLSLAAGQSPFPETAPGPITPAPPPAGEFPETAPGPIPLPVEGPAPAGPGANKNIGKAGECTFSKDCQAFIPCKSIAVSERPFHFILIYYVLFLHLLHV